jgi:MFS family permease
VLTICILGWAFDIYEATIMQLVTPILIKEWGITPAIMGTVTTISRWIGLIGTFLFPVLADLYGRRPALIWSILVYALFTGLTGFSTGWITLLIWSSITRIGLAGENPVGMLMVTETAPTKWRATALGGLVGGYPLGYMLCSLAALVVVPLWGWRSLYFLGILPALLVLWIRIGIKESPRYERVTAAMLKEGLKKQLDIFAPVRQYPREMLIASLVYFFYLFTWIGWSAWMPFYLANEKHLGFPMMSKYLSAWMFCAIFAYWICGWPLRPALGDPGLRGAGRRALGDHGPPRRSVEPVLGGPRHELPDHRQLRHRPGLHRRALPNPNPRHRGGRLVHLRAGGRVAGADDHGLDRHRLFDRRRTALAGPVIPDAGAALHLVRAGYDAQGADGFCRGEGGLKTRFPGAAQHVAQRNGALQTRDRNGRRVQSDPGSAVHRFALHRVRETHSHTVSAAAVF